MFVIITRVRRDPNAKPIHPIIILTWAGCMLGLSMTTMATFLPWTTYESIQPYSGGDLPQFSWAKATFSLMCTSSVVSILLMVLFFVIIYLLKEHGFTLFLRKICIGYLILICFNIVLLLAAFTVFDIGVSNMNVEQYGTFGFGVSVYFLYVAIGSYIFAGGFWFLFVWKYFEEYQVARYR